MEIVIIMLVAVTAMAYSLYKPKAKTKSYKVACAAYPYSHTADRIEAKDISKKKFRFDGALYCVDKYETFVVDGNSMSRWSINSGDALMVAPYENRKINMGDSIIYKIPPEDIDRETSTDNDSFKVRRALIAIDLSKDTETLCNELLNIVKETTKEDDIKIVRRKIEGARQRKKETDTDEALLSLSFKKGCVDYSVHFMVNVYGKVEFVLPRIVNSVA